MAADFGTFHVRDFPAAYYIDKTRTWIYGEISVSVEKVKFCGKNSENTEVVEQFNYADISEVKKTTTGLIFSAIVISLKNGSKHWFSSLPCRESVYNIIHYFSKQNLFLHSKHEPKSGQSLGHRTEMGRKLLSVVIDSRQTLSSAADQMISQGVQIDSAITHMDELNSDLSVADNLVTGIESWFGKWRMPKVYNKIEPLIVNNEDIPEITEYEVLYRKMEVNKMNVQQLGILRIAPEGLFILTDKQKLVHHFRWSDVSRIRVLSPCEIIVTKYLIGQPDLSFDVVCSSLIAFLKLLDKRLKSKVEYLTKGFTKSPAHQPEKAQIKHSHRLRNNKEMLLKTECVKQVPHGTHKLYVSDEHPSAQIPSDFGLTSEMQTKKPVEVVSDSEVQELQRNLEDLKCLAVAVQQETDDQNEKLGNLTESVDTANIRIRDTNTRMKKLI